MHELNGIYFTVRELASRWNIAVVTINYHIARGSLKATKVGQTFLINKDDAENFVSGTTNLRFTKRSISMEETKND